MTYDASDDVWQGTFFAPGWELSVKAALNDTWDESYGLHAVLNGDNVPLILPQFWERQVLLRRQDPRVTDDRGTPIPVRVGDFRQDSAAGRLAARLLRS